MKAYHFHSVPIAIAVCVAAYTTAHVYFVRELTAALLIFAVPFATLALAALSLFVLQQAAVQGMNALEPEWPAPERCTPPPQPTLARAPR